MGLSVWRLCCRLWYRWLSLWQHVVPPVDEGSLHWQHLSVLMFIPYECTHARREHTYCYLNVFIFIRCFMNIIVTYDFKCISFLLLSLELPLSSYHSSYEHYLHPCVVCISISPMFMLRIYSFMCWRSGTSDLLVLMLFVVQCTDYKYIFLLLLLLGQR